MQPSVFSTLLGKQLSEVGGALHRFSVHPTAAEGRLTVVHHPGKMARFFIRILRLPAEGKDLPTRILVERSGDLEVWKRSIGKSKLRTKHRAVGRYLEERAGMFRFLHEVEIVDGVMKYHQSKVYLLGLRLPHLFSPIINADASGDDQGWNLSLTVSCPRCGPICQYTGRIEPR